MTLASGTRLGPYEIVAPLGAGGMGEVYRARDSRLGREVAVKVLPAEVASDPERLRRFEQEAKAASALNHPGLLTVFDVGIDGGRSFLVTELLAGQTLRELLSAGEPIGLRRALDWATQIARGLAAAHEKGIVHRDLKPENLFVTSDDRIKILDFGLAKLTQTELDSALHDAPTLAAATETGVVLGTVGYMAPEQVRGERVDARADLFAFGCVLYELLSGERAFRGATAADTLSAILRDEPSTLERTRDGTPLAPALRRLVERCLAKRPADRWQSARDLEYRLAELGEVGGAALQVTGAELRRGLAERLRLALRLLPWLAAGALAVAAYLIAARAAPVAPIWQQVSFRKGYLAGGRFAPDGTTIYFSQVLDGTLPRVHSTRVDSPESTRLPLPPAKVYAVSARGQIALGLQGDRSGTLAIAALAGGGVRELLTGVRAADFSPDGERLAVVHSLPDRDVVELPIGTVLHDPGSGVAIHALRFAPDGASLALLTSRPVPGSIEGDFESSIALLAPDGTPTTLTSSGWAEIYGLAWHLANDEIWFTGRRRESPGGLRLHAVSRGGQTRLVTTVPGLVRIQDLTPAGAALLLHSLWPTTMVCRAPGDDREVDRTWLDFSAVADLSVDGRTVLFSEGGIAGGGGGAVYLRATSGGDAVRLGEGVAIELSHDGKWALVRPPRETGGLTLLPTGAGLPRTLELSDRVIREARLLPDGSAVLVRAADEAGGSAQLVRLPFGEGQPSPVLRRDAELGPVAPDGLRAAVRVDGEWSLLDLDGSETRRALGGLEAADVPLRFDRDGAALLVARLASPAELRRVDLRTGAVTKLHDVGPRDDANGGRIDAVRVAADGAAYCYSYFRDLSDLYVVTGLR